MLPDRVAAQAGEFASLHPQIDVRVADVIGNGPELAGKRRTITPTTGRLLVTFMCIIADPPGR